MTLPLLLVAVAVARTCDVRDFGAKGDGTTNDAESINRAITACDTILFKNGHTFVTGSVRLKSKLTIVVEPRAVIRAEKLGLGAYDDSEENPWSQYQDFGHTYFQNSMFWGIGVHNVTVTGGGYIYGDNLSTGETKSGDGNKMFAFRSSQHVRLSNLHLQRGGWFTVIVTDVDHFTMVGTEINATRDGVDICQCRHVRVDHCHIHDGGDDAAEPGGDEAVHGSDAGPGRAAAAASVNHPLALRADQTNERKLEICGAGHSPRRRVEF